MSLFTIFAFCSLVAHCVGWNCVAVNIAGRVVVMDGTWPGVWREPPGQVVGMARRQSRSDVAPCTGLSAREITVRLRALVATTGSPNTVWGLVALAVNGRVVPLELDVAPGAVSRVVVRSALTR